MTKIQSAAPPVGGRLRRWVRRALIAFAAVALLALGLTWLSTDRCRSFGGTPTAAHPRAHPHLSPTSSAAASKTSSPRR